MIRKVGRFVVNSMSEEEPEKKGLNMQIPEKMTEEQIKEKQSQLGEITHKIVIYFSDKGVGVDTLDTGCSKTQVLMGALALLSLLDKDEYTHYISLLDDGEKMFGLLKAFKKLNDAGKEEKTDGVQE